MHHPSSNDSYPIVPRKLINSNHLNQQESYCSQKIIPYSPTSLERTPALLFYYRQVQTCSDNSRLVLWKPKRVLYSDWQTGILSSSAKRLPLETDNWSIVLKLINYTPSSSNDTWSIVPNMFRQKKKIINYASSPSSNDHGAIAASHSKEHLLYCFIIYESKHVQTKKKMLRWKYKKTLQGNNRFTIRSYNVFLLSYIWLFYFFKLRCV